MTTIIPDSADTTQHRDLRERLNRLTAALNEIEPAHHNLLLGAFTRLDNLADETPGLDLGDWNQIHMRAMADVENLQTYRLAGQPYEEWGSQLQESLHILAGIISRALGEDVPVCGGDVGAMSPNEIIDAAEAIRTVTYISFDGPLSTRDAQALARLTYWQRLAEIPRQIIDALIDGRVQTPLTDAAAENLLSVLGQMPETSEADGERWLAERRASDMDAVVTALHEASTAPRLHPGDRAILRAHLIGDDTMSTVEQDVLGRIVTGITALPVDAAQALVLRGLADRLAHPGPAATLADRVVAAVAAYAASRVGEPVYGLLNGAVQTVIRTAKPDMPLDRVPAAASDALGDALADLDRDGLLPEPETSPVERATRIIAAEAARHCDSAGTTLRWALRTLIAELAHDGPSPVTDEEHRAAHDRSCELVEEMRRDTLAAEYAEQPVAGAR